jgi:hypothetical protein
MLSRFKPTTLQIGQKYIFQSPLQLTSFSKLLLPEKNDLTLYALKVKNKIILHLKQMRRRGLVG